MRLSKHSCFRVFLPNPYLPPFFTFLFLRQKALEAQGGRLPDKVANLWLINSSVRLFWLGAYMPLADAGNSVHKNMSAHPTELLLWLPVKRQANTKSHRQNTVRSETLMET